MFKLFTMAIILFISFVGAAAAQSQKEQFELQKECSQLAEKFLKKGAQEGVTTSSANHYNFRLSKCFIEVNDSQTAVDGLSFLNSYEIVDVLSGTGYASIKFFREKGHQPSSTDLTMCFINQSDHCSSVDVFNNYEKQLMEEDAMGAPAYPNKK